MAYTLRNEELSTTHLFALNIVNLLLNGKIRKRYICLDDTAARWGFLRMLEWMKMHFP